MSTVRVYELAKELNVSNKEVLDFLKSKNVDLTSHMSNVEDEHVRMVREHFKKGNSSAQNAGKQGRGRETEEEIYPGVPSLRTPATCRSAEQKPTGRQGRPGQDQERQIINAGRTVREIAEGHAGGMRQENRNNRPNGSRHSNGQTGDNRQNRPANGGDQPPAGPFSQ